MTADTVLYIRMATSGVGAVRRFMFGFVTLNFDTSSTKNKDLENLEVIKLALT